MKFGECNSFCDLRTHKELFLCSVVPCASGNGVWQMPGGAQWHLLPAGFQCCLLVPSKDAHCPLVPSKNAHCPLVPTIALS